MKTTPGNLNEWIEGNKGWKAGHCERPTAYISDDEFDAILEDLQYLQRLQKNAVLKEVESTPSTCKKITFYLEDGVIG